MGKLDNKIAIVTGGNSGIGYAMTKRFIEDGAKVVAADLSEKVHDLSEEFGDSVLPEVVNVSKEDDVKNLIEKSIEHFGKVDILVNNAGIGGNQGKIEEVTGDDFRQVLDINLMGPFFGIKHIIPHFLNNGGGTILNTASTAAFSKSVSGMSYAVSKSAVKKLTESTAFDYADKGIRVNAIAPGSVETPIFDGLDDLKNQLKESIPTNQLAQPSEISSVAAFLVSDEASYITGHTQVVDGGQLLN